MQHTNSPRGHKGMVQQVLKLARAMHWPLRRFAIASLPRVVCGAEVESSSLHESARAGPLRGGGNNVGGGKKLCAPYTRPEDSAVDRQIVALLRDSLADKVLGLGS